MTVGPAFRLSFVLYCTFGVLLAFFIGGCAVILGDIPKHHVETDWKGIRNSVFIILLFNLAYGGLALSVSPGDSGRYQGIAMMLLGLAYLISGPLLLSRMAMLQFPEHPFLFGMVAIKAILAMVYGYMIGRSGSSSGSAA